MAATLELTIDDGGTLGALVGKATRFNKRALRMIDASVDEYAEEFRDEVRSRAEGRPGPRKVTGDYWNSIQVVSRSTFFRHSFSKSVTSDHPAAARLELGYVGVDALGRHYNQPPFKHWEPAIQVIGERWLASFGDTLPEWWRAA